MNDMEKTKEELIGELEELRQRVARLEQQETQDKGIEEALGQSEARYRSLFEHAPISMWELDLSAVKEYVDNLRIKGSIDLNGFFEAHPEAIAECVARVKPVTVNQITLQRSGAKSSDELLAGLAQFFSDETRPGFLEGLVALAEGATQFQFETMSHTLTGDLIYADVRVAIAPAYEKSWGKVFVSVIDITDRKQKEEEHLAHLRFFESMDQVNRAIHGTNDLEQMMRDALDALLSIFACDRAWLTYPCDPTATKWQVPMERTRPEYPGVLPQGVELPLDPVGVDVFRILRASPDPVQFGPEAEHQVAQEIAQGFSVQSFIAMALYPKVGKPWSFGLHQCSYPRIWTPQEERFFQQIGRRLSDALTSLLAYREVQQSERELRQSNDLLRAIIEAAPTAIIGLDLDGNVQMVWNPAAERMLGWSAEEAIGHPLPSVPVDSHEEFKGFRERIRRGESMNGIEVRRKRRDGTPIDYSIYASPIHDSEGHIIGNIAVLVDITERKQADETLRQYAERLEALNDQVQRHSAELEQRVTERTAELAAAKQQIETILQNVADAVVFTDDDANIHYVNPAWEELTGYSLTEANEQNPRILKGGDTPSKTYEKMWQTILKGDTWRGVLHNKRKDGTLYDAELTVAPVKDEHDTILGFVGVQRDVTEERQLAAMKEQFIADAAHDLGNPVTILQTNLYLLRKDPSQLDRRLENFERATDQLAALLRDLLTISRLDRKIMTATLQPIDFNELVTQVVEAQRLLAGEKSQQLVFEGNQNLPLILADRVQLERVVVNLVANAVNYTPEGGDISVRTFQANNQIALVVKDTGIGISPDDQRRIFERFYRSDNAKMTSEGTGLGLSIVKEIVNLHGGKIELESALGQGSTFTVLLPRFEPESQAVDE